MAAKVFEHINPGGTTDATTYLTPRWITDSLGPFDMDVAASKERPWDIAKICLVGEHAGGQCGLKTPWRGFVWCNPPYSLRQGENKFIQKMADHGNGLALVNVKTATVLWQDIIFRHATTILFLRKRVMFLTTAGEPTGGTFGNQCLIAFGNKAARRLAKLSQHGHLQEISHDN